MARGDRKLRTPAAAPTNLVVTGAVQTQRIVGGVRNDVACDASGDSIAITISDEAANGVASWGWVVTVFAMLPGGMFQLGQAEPANPADFQYIPASRVAVFATCPGARGWLVSFFTGNAFALADVTISPSPYPLGGAGVVANVPGILTGQ